LPYGNFYSFKIFPHQDDKNKEERKELLRLIKDAQKHGKWFIGNFDFESAVISLPISFTHKESLNLKDRVDHFFKNTVKDSAQYCRKLVKEHARVNKEQFEECAIADRIEEQFR
jgi:hypothetical protein